MPRANYETLCPKGQRIDVQAREMASRLHEVVRILLDSEENRPERVAHYRAELATTKAKRDDYDLRLMRHVAHCSDGCRRAQGGPMAFAAEGQAGVYDRAPTHRKPPLPGAGDLAARLRDGATLDDLAAEYERDPNTIRMRLINAGYSAATGQPTHQQPKREDAPPNRLAILRLNDQPWAVDALCAETDPEAFYPEKGGSTREAKQVCASCLVQAECLDYALDNGERFGIWGGLSERERRRIKKALTIGTPAGTPGDAA